MRGVLHLPEGPGPHPAVLCLHGLGGHRIEAHRLFVKLARSLADHDLAALRIDFRGAGESDGEAAERSISSELSDARTAYAHLAGHPSVDRTRLAVLGLSLGGAVAALLAGETEGSDLPPPAALVLWSAVADLQELFLPAVTPEARARLEGGDPVVWGAEEVGPAFYQDLLHLEPLAGFARHRGPALVVHGEGDGVVPPGQARRWGQVRGGVDVVLVPGAGHTFERPDWEREVLEVTVRWLVKRLQRSAA
nr:alpha/beta fold hydrolase [Limnochorda pilosa]